jgi:hypothetical protein
MFDDPTIFQDETEGAVPPKSDYPAHGPATIRFITRGYDPLDEGAGIVLRVGCSSCDAEFTFSIDAIDQWLAVFGKGRRLTLSQKGLRGIVSCPRCQHGLTYKVEPDEVREYGDIPISALVLWLPQAVERVKVMRTTNKEAIDRLVAKVTPWRQRPDKDFYGLGRNTWGIRDFGYGEVEGPFPRWLFFGINHNLRYLTDTVAEGVRRLAPMDSHIIQHAERLDVMNRTMHSIESKLGRIADGMSYYVERDKQRQERIAAEHRKFKKQEKAKAEELERSRRAKPKRPTSKRSTTRKKKA